MEYDLTGSDYSRINKTINLLCDKVVTSPLDFQGRFQLQSLLYNLCSKYMSIQQRSETEVALDKLRQEKNKGFKKSQYVYWSDKYERELFEFIHKNIKAE